MGDVGHATIITVGDTSEDVRGTESNSPIEDDAIVIAEADKFVKEQYGEECDYYSHHQGHGPSQDDDDDIIPQYHNYVVLTKVLGDAFHVMDRVKVPMHHDFKPSFFRALRGAIFILNPQDVSNVKTALRIVTTKEWNMLLAFNFKYVAQRVRRRIPPPDLLHARVKAVFDHFEDTEDAKSGKPLFNAAAKQKAKLVLEMVKSGLLSDPPGFSFYVKRMDANGRLMTDKHGL